MLIGVISDTHDNIIAAKKANDLFRARNVDLVIHLGDFVAPFTFKSVFAGFEGKGYAVLGNNDGEKMVLYDIAARMNIVLKSFPYSIEVDGKRILLFHGFGPTENTVDIARSLLLSGRYDIVLFGHTHEKLFEKISSRLLLNPGEASGVLYGNKSVALLDTFKMEVEFIDLD